MKRYWESCAVLATVGETEVVSASVPLRRSTASWHSLPASVESCPPEIPKTKARAPVDLR